MKRILLLLLLTGSSAFAQSWEQNYADKGFMVQDTTIRGRRAVYVVPPQANGRWIARPAFIGAFAQVDDALLERGWSFGLLDLMDEYATPDAQDAFTAFCDYGHKRHGLSEQVVLEGLSRGGWFSLVYAENHPDRVDKLYLDAPLCLLTGFDNPHIRNAEAQWAAAGIPPEAFHTYARDHFSRIKDKPVIVVYGAADPVVPFEKQFGTFDLSGCRDLSIIGKTGVEHHPHSLSPCDTIVRFLVKDPAAAVSSPVRVTFVGASITEGIGTADPATESYPAVAQRLLGDGWHIENYGVSACTMLRHGDFPYWTKGRLGEALAIQPDIVFIDLGGNDTKPQNAVFVDKEFADDAESLVRIFRSLPTHPRVILVTPTWFTGGNYGISDKVSQEQVCPALYEAAKRTGTEVLDLYPVLQEAQETLAGDGVHPDTRGAALLGEKTAWYLKTYPAKPAEEMTIDGMADNPFITHLYTADPSAHVWADGRLYVYASHDIAPPRGCDLMDQYHVFSTDDMVHWTDHGEILRASDVPWGRKEGGFMWAPDCAYRNGKYYFYFPHPSGTHTGSTWKIGVAVSDKPASDFKVGGYIKGMTSHIDPCVFVDDDGQAYIYNGGGGQCFGAKLRRNMTQLQGKPVPMEGLVDFHEGTWVHKYKGKYYLSYPDNHIGPDGKQYNRMHYAMSDSPLGPWEYKGIILDETDCDTSHGSIVEFKGQWYLFYHGCQLTQMGNLRSICVDRLYYNDDGTIRKVHQRHHSYIPRI